MEQKLKICFATPQLTGGGAERVVSVLASTLAEMGHDVAIVIYDRRADEYSTSSMVKKYYLSDEEYSTFSLVRRIQRIRYVRKYIKENKFQYVVPFLWRAVVQTFISTRGVDIKFISTLRNNPYELSRSERIKTDIVTLFADAHFVQNEMQKNYYWKIIQKKTFVLPNPVGDIFVNNCKQYSNEVNKIISVGRLNKQKNFDLLINAMEIVVKEYPYIKAEIWGLGEEEERLKKIINEKKLENVISLCGRTNNVMTVLDGADLFVMTSDFEGMPNSLLEAMTFGMPCISTDCPTGPSDLIKNCRTGILIRMNSTEELADAIKKLIDNPHEAINMGKAARKSIGERHSAKAIAERFVEECINI